MVNEVFSLGDDAGKIAHLQEVGFPNHELIEKALEDNDYDVRRAWYVLIKDLMDNGEKYFKPVEVTLRDGMVRSRI